MNDAYETESWMLTIGAAPGAQPLISEEELSQIYTDCALKIFDETDVPIPVSIWKKKEVVRDENGRPVSGDPCYEMRGSWDPEFAGKEAYGAALLRFLPLLSEALGQKAVILEIQPPSLTCCPDGGKPEG